MIASSKWVLPNELLQESVHKYHTPNNIKILDKHMYKFKKTYSNEQKKV